MRASEAQPTTWASAITSNFASCPPEHQRLSLGSSSGKHVFTPVSSRSRIAASAFSSLLATIVEQSVRARNRFLLGRTRIGIHKYQQPCKACVTFGPKRQRSKTDGECNTRLSIRCSASVRASSAQAGRTDHATHSLQVGKAGVWCVDWRYPRLASLRFRRRHFSFHTSPPSHQGRDAFIVQLSRPPLFNDLAPQLTTLKRAKASLYPRFDILDTTARQYM